MKIVKIKKYPRFRNHFKIEFDSGQTLIADADTIVKFNLKNETEIEEKELKEIEKNSKSNNIMSYAFFLISKKAFSGKSLQDTLALKGFEKPDIEKVISRFKELNYLNDEVFAQNLISYLKKKGKGRYYIQNELKKHAIDAGIFKETDGGISQCDEIIAIIKKRYCGFKGTNASETRKIASFFLRRGFASEDIAKAFRKYGKDTEIIKDI